MENDDILKSARCRLEAEKCSCVVVSGSLIVIGRERGVRDIWRLYSTSTLLKGAVVADKVVGKGAAALLTAGGVARLYAAVISRPAHQMLVGNGVDVTYATIVDNIINRAATGVCPLEALCASTDDVESCVERVKEFVSRL